MEFNRFVLLDSINERFIASVGKTTDVDWLASNGTRKKIQNALFAERARSVRVGLRDCKKYDRFIKRIKRKEKFALKRIKKSVLKKTIENEKTRGKNLNDK